MTPRARPVHPKELPRIGWREWVALPDLGIPHVKAKIDTGARTSAMHAFDFEYREVDGQEIVEFQAHPEPWDDESVVACSAEVLEHRAVTNSGGTTTVRPVILTHVQIGPRRWPIELTLVSREGMGFRMLLGRLALRGRYLVDSERSFLWGGTDAGPRSKRSKGLAS